MSSVTFKKFEFFKKLHNETFVIPNPWDAGSACILKGLGYQALATTSAGYAFSKAKADSSDDVLRTDILNNAKEIVDATDLPVSADLENGFGITPDYCAETIALAQEIGLVGGSIEDASGDKEKPIYDFNHAVERIIASCEETREKPFLLTARAENFLHGRPNLDDTINRLLAFEKAGADVLYAPGLPDLNAIKTVCDAISKPVNVVMGLNGPTYSVVELQEVGVKRISVGGSFARAALGGFLRAAEEVKKSGTFTYAKDAMPVTTIMEYLKPENKT